MKSFLKSIVVALVIPLNFTVMASTNFEAELRDSFFIAMDGGNSLDSSARFERNHPLEISASCTFKSESTSGNNKICVYSCLTGDKAINVGAMKPCPLYIK